MISAATQEPLASGCALVELWRFVSRLDIFQEAMGPLWAPIPVWKLITVPECVSLMYFVVPHASSFLRLKLFLFCACLSKVLVLYFLLLWFEWCFFFQALSSRQFAMSRVFPKGILFIFRHYQGMFGMWWCVYFCCSYSHCVVTSWAGLVINNMVSTFDSFSFLPGSQNSQL